MTVEEANFTRAAVRGNPDEVEPSDLVPGDSREIAVECRAARGQEGVGGGTRQNDCGHATRCGVL
jgi:hypothetical protein